MNMKPFFFLLTGAAALSALVTPAAAQRSRDQDAAFEARRSGQILPLREIEKRILPRMNGARYLGPEFDSGSSSYRLKFMRGGNVIWIDVDGRTGAVLSRSGN